MTQVLGIAVIAVLIYGLYSIVKVNQEDKRIDKL
jgi:hypothetical protein